MGKRMLGGLIAVLFVIGLFIIYYRSFSFSGALQKHGFSTKDIVTAEGYSIDASHLTKLLLLANEDKLGIMTVTNQGFEFWKNEPFSTVEPITPTDGKYVVMSMPIMKNWGENNYSEVHIFVAEYINNQSKPKITGTADFYLNVDYFEVNNRTLLFAHAIAGKNKKSFGSDEVMTYLNTFMK